VSDNSVAVRQRLRETGDVAEDRVHQESRIRNLQEQLDLHSNTERRYMEMAEAHDRIRSEYLARPRKKSETELRES